MADRAINAAHWLAGQQAAFQDALAQARSMAALDQANRLGALLAQRAGATGQLAAMEALSDAARQGLRERSFYADLGLLGQRARFADALGRAGLMAALDEANRRAATLAQRGAVTGQLAALQALDNALREGLLGRQFWADLGLKGQIGRFGTAVDLADYLLRSADIERQARSRLSDAFLDALMWL
jgi:hypothetical protein